MADTDEKAKELASDLFAAFERLTSDGKRPKVSEAYDVRCVEIIKSALQAQRDAALEEAAIKLEELREVYRQPEYAWPNGCVHSIVMATSHAEAIRALKAQPPTEDSDKNMG